jgi:hypothetical protein
VGRTWERNLYENEITIFFGGGGRFHLTLKNTIYLWDTINFKMRAMQSFKVFQYFFLSIGKCGFPLSIIKIKTHLIVSISTP